MNAPPEGPQAEEPPAPRPEPAGPQIPVPDDVPVIAAGSNVMYPQQLMPVLATEERDIKAIDEAAASEAKVLGIFAQKEVEEGRYEGDLYPVGTAATIVRMAKAPDGSVHAILQGVARIHLVSLERSEPWMRARVERLWDAADRGLELEALLRETAAAFQRVVNLSETLPKELAAAIGNVTDPSALADFVAANLPLRPEQRQAILEELHVNSRLITVRDLLTHELEVLEVQSKI
ncbi:MAG TPA: LON peptidase substrate-binding domain-containing protein, partial [Dehalococcoidia bacterium]|nr:LON peptidase substrate-binding domain-containing protein [Dehalococcoidia bacterium]